MNYHDVEEAEHLAEEGAGAEAEAEAENELQRILEQEANAEAEKDYLSPHQRKLSDILQDPTNGLKDTSKRNGTYTQCLAIIEKLENELKETQKNLDLVEDEYWQRGHI